MPIVVTVKIPGLKNLQRRFKRSPQIVGKHTAEAINNASREIIRETLPITPEDKGDLKKSIRKDFLRATPSSLVGAVRGLRPYAKFVHNLYPPGQRYKNPTKNKSAVAGFLIIGQERAQRATDKIFDRALNKIVKEMGD